MRLYFVRHGQSENNVVWERTKSSKGRRSDPQLTEIGTQQAEHAARFLSRLSMDLQENHVDSNGRGITHIYASLMVRAVATATIIAKKLSLPLIAWRDIHEAGGIYDEDPISSERIGGSGKNRSYFETHYPQFVLPDWLDERGWWNRPFEERHELAGRAKKVISSLLLEHGNKDDWVVFVSHGDFYQRFLAQILRLPPRYYHHDYPERTLDLSSQVEVEEPIPGLAENLWFQINNAAISRFDFHEEYVNIVYLNRSNFLPPELIS